MSMRHYLDVGDIDKDELAELMELAESIRNRPPEYAERCRGRILATLFYEPSTRTQFSFQAAMQRLGGSVIGFDNPGGSSVAKGESLKDTILITGGYSDVLVMRHPKEGAAAAAALYSAKPVVNAGDGAHSHPTQTLADLLTLRLEKGRLSGLTVAVCGDLLNGRTVHSLLKALSRYRGNRFVLISTPRLAAPGYIKRLIEESGNAYDEASSLEEGMAGCDALYMTRIQKERFDDPEDYERQKDVYRLDADKLSRASRDMIVLHPLPRIDEIAEEADGDPRALYFKQAENGMYMRMALIIKLLEARPVKPERSAVTGPARCASPRCITRTEAYLPPLTAAGEDGEHCYYCEAEV